MTAQWFVFVGLLVGLALFGRPRALSGPGQDSPLEIGPVRIVIPARNEAASIGNLLADLERSVRPDWDVVVVDDGSTDDTVAIAGRYSFARVITAPELPSRWRGKPWACSIGASDRGNGGCPRELVFLDADVRLAPGAIEAVVSARQAHGGVLSVQPFHSAPTAVEELSAVFNVVSMMGVGAATDHPHGMFGPVVSCDRRDYEAVGGHGAVRSEVAEDVALGRVFVSAGIAVAVMTGGDLVSFRMYPTGLAALVEGWSKNMAIGAGSVPWWRTLGVGWWMTALLSASMVPVAMLSEPSWVAAAVYAATGLSLRLLVTRVGTFRWWVSAAFPVVAWFFVAVFVRSLWLTHVRQAVTWRGRTISLDVSDVAVPSTRPGRAR